MQNLLPKLQEIVGPHGVITEPHAESRYHGDWSTQAKCSPLAVVRPSTTQEVAQILAACHEANQPVVVQGGLTGLSGGATPANHEIALSLERLSGIEELDTQSMTMTVGAGTPLELIQNAAEAAGFRFPLDLGARGSCNIGGNIATNAGGNQVIRYGMTRNLVLGLETVLADGTIISSLNRMLKNNAGYDLKHLFIGSEGTLGVITRAVLRLFPRLGNKCTALCAVDSFTHVVELLHLLGKRFGGELNTFEVMWASYFDHIVANLAGARSPFDVGQYPLYALIEIETADEADGLSRLEEYLAGALEDGTLQDVALAQSLREAEGFWKIRDGVSELPNLLTETAAFDVSVPINVMEAFVADVEASLTDRFDSHMNLVFGHIGDNNLHFLIDTGDKGDYKAINDTVYAVVGRYHGSVSAEHGIGVIRKSYLPYSRTPEEIELMKRLKSALDPNNILNPGRVF
jgi:FAD/FMN-containing dehydrogenase